VQALRHKELVMVVEGVRRRLASAPSPDPILLINFPDLDNQFKAGWSMRDSLLGFSCTATKIPFVYSFSGNSVASAPQF
jgi:hypothetical protein